APAAARRAVVRPRPARRARDLRHHAPHQRAGGRVDPARRAERVDGARARRPRVPARDGSHRARRTGRRAAARRHGAPCLSGGRLMEGFLHQVFAGLATGGIYASVALALVMIYQTTHLVNFAQGEMAMFSTYLAWTMVNAGLPYWAAFALTIVAAFVLGAAIERIVSRPVEDAPVLAVVVVFIGLLLIHNSLAGWLWSYTIKTFPSPFPSTPVFGQTLVSAHELGAIGVTLVVLALLFAFFRWTPLGLAMRAVAQNPGSARLVGIRVGWMLALGWGLAGAVGAVAGMMVAPIVYLEPNMMG